MSPFGHEHEDSLSNTSEGLVLFLETSRESGTGRKCL